MKDTQAVVCFHVNALIPPLFGQFLLELLQLNGIQDAGLQGYQIGGVQVSKKHAGFMVNIDNGTATDYMDLIRYVQKVILEKDGVALEPEVRIIGEEPTSN